jgi:hypothetical protein
VSCGIPICRDGILSLEHDVSIESQERPERLVSGHPGSACQFDSLFREADIHIDESPQRRCGPRVRAASGIVAQFVSFDTLE